MKVTTYSNLSKVKPALRTKGKLTGNFGSPKRTKEAYNSGLGVTKAKVVNITTQDEYLKKMFQVFDTTTDPKLKKFAYTEIRKIMVQRGQWQ